AFYSNWFINRVRAGFLLTRNPFNYSQITRVSLTPEDVDVIVFWTRNPKKIMSYLPELDALGINYYFQYTITGYPKNIDTKNVSPYKSIETFKELSRKIGSDRVIWRYDPILLSNYLPFEEHLRLFEKIASLLQGFCNRVVISFADFYKKTEKNLGSVDGLVCSDILEHESKCRKLSRCLADIAHNYGLDIYSCSEDVDLAQSGIAHGKCIDDNLIKEVFNIDVNNVKDKGQREACGCVKSIDIGMYNTCLHGCKYCYATFNEKAAHTNYKKHDPDSPFLLGGVEDVPEQYLVEPIIQQPLF
ncbi:DUF1848 domain-containing protein, partial [Vibrio parahaemolyticus]|nr:DUF1848 domain-containing protein [Vibrio parahaemolyticus]